MKSLQPVIVSLGESALVMQWGNAIDRTVNRKVTALAAAISKQPFEGLVDLVPGYCSLTVLYDVCLVSKSLKMSETAFAVVKQYLEQQMETLVEVDAGKNRLVEIPVCYDALLKNDLAAIGAATGLPVKEVITIHSSTEYYVYMLGFLPGFAYMGEVDERIAMPRKQKPMPITAGAVGITGKQTGIYPVNSPGGWQIVGYTPLKMLDMHAAAPSLLAAGDLVLFSSIGISEYYALKNLADL